MDKMTKHIIKAIEKTTKMEKARYPDWNDDKHIMNVKVNIDEDNKKVVVTATKENIVRDNLQSIAKYSEVLGWNNKENK